MKESSEDITYLTLLGVVVGDSDSATARKRLAVLAIMRVLAVSAPEETFYSGRKRSLLRKIGHRFSDCGHQGDATLLEEGGDDWSMLDCGQVRSTFVQKTD